MVSLKKILFKEELSIEDLTYICKLLDTKMSFHQVLDLLENKSNTKIFKKIVDSLNKGKMIEEIMPEYLPKNIKSYLLPLLKTMPFASALSLSLEFNEKHSNIQNKIIGSIAYPCILLFVTITVLYLFDLYGMDTIFNLIGTFNNDIGIYVSIRKMFRVFINIFYYGTLLVALLVVFFMQPNRIALLYVFLSKHLPNSLINAHYSQEFVSLLLVCIDKGYKTKESLEILKAMKSKPIVSFLAFHLDESLLQGESLKDAAKNKYYDLALSKFIKIANYTNEFSKMLTNYTTLTSQKIENKIKKYTLTIQLATYSFIGVIVVFIYQILFIPMQALSAY